MNATLRTPTADSARDAHLSLSTDCVADSAGGLTFDLADPGARGDAHLLLRLRASDVDGEPDEVRLPLTPAGHGRLRAVLPSSVDLPEGRWDAYAEYGASEPRRLVPGLNDLRSLVDRVPSGARGHVAVRIPYATKYGNLTVRAWHRAPHAEGGELYIGDTELTVHGRLFGTTPTSDAYAEAHSRRQPALTHRADVTSQGADFTCTLDHQALAAQPGSWDLWLYPSGAAGPRVRIARLLDDVADKKPIFTYPLTRLDTEAGPVDVGPYYTTDNDLSVRVVTVA
ncbi:hypothetical protein [Streptomyces apocyni]|uniref:hypothetical protein n=1 Tax=Streptomyces apocyni TaxID=2654677 RepID=UPI001E2AB16B|nr:hypothetical protein [Streptomyces apocyni]